MKYVWKCSLFLSPFAVNLATLKFSSLEPQHGAPLVMLTYLYFLVLAPSFFFFFPSFPLFLSFFLSLCFFSFPSLWRPRRARAPKTPRYAPAYMFSLYTRLLMPLIFFVLSFKKFQPILQKVESRLLTFLPYFFDFTPSHALPPYLVCK